MCLPRSTRLAATSQATPSAPISARNRTAPPRTIQKVSNMLNSQWRARIINLLDSSYQEYREFEIARHDTMGPLKTGPFWWHSAARAGSASAGSTGR